MSDQKRIFNIDWILLSRRICLVLLDSFIITFCMGMALWLRFDFRLTAIDPVFLESVSVYWHINVICTLMIFTGWHLYRSLWRFASVEEVKYVCAASVLSGIVQQIGMLILNLPVPRSYPILYTFLLLMFTTVSRFSYRIVRNYMQNIQHKRTNDGRRVMVIGAGSSGFLLVKEMKSNKHLNQKVCCIIDDSPAKIGTYLQGIPVVGGHDSISENVKKYDIQDIIIAIPSLEFQAKKELLNVCQATGCHVLIVPSIHQLVDEEVSVGALREVQIEDLLGRDAVEFDSEEISEYIEDKVVLVTGGGGSIGSELCRQIAKYKPKTLIVFEIYENNAYDIQMELKRRYPALNLKILIGSVRNSRRLNSVFDTYRPNLVFHAAAHKHVPLMEESPNEAVKNNILGTWNVARAADRFGADKMVLISTDKAVRPTNIMGASKRVCEMIIDMCSRQSHSSVEYAAVRFGNVLGSNGSVIPLFRKQIAEGGPVTVTDRRVIRYFMTIPEAVNLVLQCGALAKGGEIFILDMGEPVKIDDLARNMIRLSGLEPERDIEIRYTGLRPGEKLYEELLIDEDNLLKTEKERIFVAMQPEQNMDHMEEYLIHLIESAWNEDEDICQQVKAIVPEYTIYM